MENINNKTTKNQNLAELEFEEIILEIKRVTKVVKGGKNLKFRAIVTVGDHYAKAGIGIGKAEDVNLSIQKAILSAKKKLTYLPITKTNSIPSRIQYKHGSAQILLLPAKYGTGIKAGGALRAILEVGGLTNIVGKQFGSENILNNAKATIGALTYLKDRVATLATLSKRNIKFFRKSLKNFELSNNEL